MMIKVVLCFCILALCVVSNADNQGSNLYDLIRSRRSPNLPVPDTWEVLDGSEEYSPVYIAPQDGLAQLDKIVGLPGQPEGVDFDQYSGYVTVDPSPTEGKALFYYFAESPQNSSTNPLVLWLNGGTTAYYSLAYTIVLNNKKTNQTIINLKGIAIGNAWIDDVTNWKGLFDHWWTHAINSDETHEGVLKYCNFVNDSSTECDSFFQKAWDEWGNIDLYNIYAPICLDSEATNGSTGSVSSFDACWESHLTSYLNTAELQTAFHVKPTEWAVCGHFNWGDSPTTILPIIEYLIANGLRLWIYSGDVDGRVPITSSRYSINAMKLPVQTAFRPWYQNKEVGGYFVEYKGAILITVRGAGHTVPSYQPERALTMFSSFLQGILPPSE